METDLDHRIRIGRKIVNDHVAYFEKHVGLFPGEFKADKTRVTEADLRLNAEITGALALAFPQDDIVSEEALPANGPQPLRARFCWVLDPIDGTNNYARGYPLCAISLALLEDGVPVYGFIHDHARGRLVQGGPGRGLFDGCVAAPTPARDTEFDRNSLVSFHFPMPEPHLGVALALLKTNPARCSGSCALNLTYNALGILDGSTDHNTKVWDVAAACALLAAAGRTIRFFGIPPFPFRVAEPQPRNLHFVCGSSGYVDRVMALYAEAGVAS
jgi:myo-inositol-1(or 4)-monophosphatase